MEDLSRHQLILLVLLVSFVTSIATGIITFTLLQEAPVEVTQNINRVVERTIERVVPAEGEKEKVVTTVVVNEDDRIVEAITKNEKSIVRLRTTALDGSELFAGLGLVVSDSGVVVADSRGYNSATPFSITFADGKVFSSGRVYADDSSGLVFVKTDLPQTEKGKYTFVPVTLGDSDALKIGQSLVAVSGRDSNAASIGRVFQLKFADDKKSVTNIFSDIKVSKAHLGSPILNLTGEIVGLEAPLAEADTEYAYLPSNVIKASLTKALAELNKQ